MANWQIVLIVIALFFVPTIIFKFIDPKDLGKKLDDATERMKARTIK
jgi:hypothetical protein